MKNNIFYSPCTISYKCTGFVPYVNVRIGFNHILERLYRFPNEFIKLFLSYRQQHLILCKMDSCIFCEKVETAIYYSLNVAKEEPIYYIYHEEGQYALPLFLNSNIPNLVAVLRQNPIDMWVEIPTVLTIQQAYSNAKNAGTEVNTWLENSYIQYN